MNLLIAYKINYTDVSLQTFKLNVKRFLLARQNFCQNGDPNWLPNNKSIFSDIV